MKIAVKLNPPRPEEKTVTTYDKLEKSRMPYKLRSLATGEIKVVIKVPTSHGGPYTHLFIDDGDTLPTWCDGRPDGGVHYINTTFEFVGPLEPGETITITG
jgi:hypothetical protein